MNKLQHKLKQILRENECISVAKFMEEVVPFYYANNIAIGKDGDFITAPQVSQLFGEVIALWIINHCINNKITKFNLIEFGPGKGTLMLDILRTIKQFKAADKALNCVYLFEGSEKLQSVQRTTLLPFNKNIIWENNLERIAKSTKGVCNILIANEFFDCLPIRQFLKTKNGISEITISLNKEAMQNEALDLQFSLQPTNYKPKIPLQTNEVYEQNTNYKYYCTQIANILNKSKEEGANNSCALIIDYGYIEKPIKSTLQALYRHKYHNPLQNIGYADLTALVNFSELVELFKATGLNARLTLQGDFLREYGIVARSHDLLDRTGVDLSSQLERLTASNQMGALFKVLEIF